VVDRNISLSFSYFYHLTFSLTDENIHTLYHFYSFYKD